LLAGPRLARPEAGVEELKIAIFDMAMPLAVFRSKSLQELGKKEGDSYFQAGSSGRASPPTPPSPSPSPPLPPALLAP
jgi:hypothetical protein